MGSFQDGKGPGKKRRPDPNPNTFDRTNELRRVRAERDSTLKQALSDKARSDKLWKLMDKDATNLKLNRAYARGDSAQESRMKSEVGRSKFNRLDAELYGLELDRDAPPRIKKRRSSNR